NPRVPSNVFQCGAHTLLRGGLYRSNRGYRSIIASEQEKNYNGLKGETMTGCCSRGLAAFFDPRKIQAKIGVGGPVRSGKAALMEAALQTIRRGGGCLATDARECVASWSLRRVGGPPLLWGRHWPKSPMSAPTGSRVLFCAIANEGPETANRSEKRGDL